MGVKDTKPTKWTKRLFAFFIDLLFINLIFYLFKGFLEIEKSGSSLILSISITFSYYIFFEYFFYNTIGKGVMGITIISTKTNEQDATLNQIVIRNLLRLIPFEILTFISLNPYGFHDKNSDTKVIDNNEKILKTENTEALRFLKKLDSTYLSSKKWDYILKKRILIFSSILSLVCLILLKNEIFSSQNFLVSIVIGISVFVILKILFLIFLLVIWIIHQVFQFSIAEKNYILLFSILIIFSLVSIKTNMNFPFLMGIVPFICTLIIGKIIYPSNKKLKSR